MNILILHDYAQSGRTPALSSSGLLATPDSWGALTNDVTVVLFDPVKMTADALRTEDQDHKVSGSIWENTWDIIVVYNAMEPYLANRFNIKGRPWICSASFHFEDTHTFYQGSIPIAEMGLDALFTNCQPFVERAAPHIPTKFMWPPLGHPEGYNGYRLGYKIGSYVPNISDRDFSQIELCYQLLKSRGLEGNFSVFSPIADELKAAFPDAGFTESIIPDKNTYGNIPFFVPAPRISDILYGVIDDVLLSAIMNGSKPLLIRHGKFPQLTEWIKPMFESVLELELKLISICEGNTDILDIEARRLFEPGDTDRDFVNAVITAYKRKAANGTTGRD